MFRMQPKTYIAEMLGNIKCLVGCQANDKTGLGVAERIYEVLVDNGLLVGNIAFQSYDYA